MAAENLNSLNQMVKQSNELARAKDDVNSPTASRVLAGLIAQVDNNDLHFKKEYSFPIAILDNLNSGSKRARIRLAIDELSKCRVWLEDAGKISAIPFFTIITYADGIISGEFNEKIAPYLLGLKGCFTQFTLSEYFCLPSTYSQKMFKLLKSLENGLHKDYIDMSLKDLQEYLQTPISLNKQYKDFKKRVLQKAEKDINENTSIQFKWEPIKTGRTITAIRFSIKTKRNSKVLPNVNLPSVTVTQQTLLTSIKNDKDTETAARNCARAKLHLKGNFDCEIISGKKICELCRQKVQSIELDRYKKEKGIS